MRFGRLRLALLGRRERASAGSEGCPGPALSAAEVDALLLEADAAGFTRGQLATLTRVVELWASVTEQVRSDIEHAYRDGERAGRAEGRDDLGCLAHQHAALERMQTYLNALANQGNALLFNLGKDS